MKLKYQQGGGLIYTPFIPGRSATAGAASSSKSGSSEDDPKLDPLDKEILALMKDKNLLPSDIQSIYSALTAFQRRTQHLSGIGGTAAYRSVMPGMLQIMNMVSLARANKDQWDKSVAEVKNHDAGSEVALDAYGRMWVQDKDRNLSKVNPNDFDSSSQIPISNSQLLALRQRNNDFAFSDNLFGETGMDVVGMKDIRAEIAAVTSAFGKVKSDSMEARSIANLANAVAENGYFKVSEEITRSIASPEDLDKFTMLLWQNLGSSSQHLLTARAALNGTKNPLLFLRDMVFANSDSSITSSFDSSLTKAAGGIGGNDEKLNTHDTYPERLATGEDIAAHWEVIQTSASGHKMWAYTQDMGTAMKDGKSMGTVNMDLFLKTFDASGIIDWANASFGDYKLANTDLSKVIYDGSSQIKRVWLPVKEDGSVDFRAQEQMSTLQNWINENGVINETLIEEKVAEIPNAEWDSEKKMIVFKNAKPFLVVRGVSSSEKVDFNKSSNYIHHMEKEPGDQRADWKEIYNNGISTGDVTEGKTKYDNGRSWGRNLYEGNIFLPISSETIGALIYNKQWMNKSRYTDIRQKVELNEKKANFKGNYDE